MEEIKDRVLQVITDGTLDYRQKKHHLAYIAESTQVYPDISDEAKTALQEKVICDLFEGSAPYRQDMFFQITNWLLKMVSVILNWNPLQI